MPQTNVSQRPVHKTASSKLHEIYNEMRSRQKKAILQANGMRSDPYFIPDNKVQQMSLDGTSSDHISASLSGDVSVDRRRCFAVSAIIDNDSTNVTCSWNEKYFELHNRLKQEFGDYGLIFSQEPPLVGGGQLHWTLMQLVGFSHYSQHVLNEDETESVVESTFLSSEYLDCIQDSLTVGGLDTAIHMHYVGVIAVSTGLLMIGVPSLDINETRDVVRSRLKQQNLPLMEPFVNDIVHSTLFRVAGDSKDIPSDLHHRILKLAEEYKNVSLGTAVLSKFQIGPASWRLLKNEIEETPPVRQWALPVVTPCEQYNATIVTEEDGMGRECFTVSGASGNNLAKEVRNFLNRQDSRSDHPDFSMQQPLLSINPNGSQNSWIMKNMKNDVHEVRERIDGVHVRDSVPRVSDNGQSEGYLLENSSLTLTGIGGANLALELKKKLDEEQKLMDNAYYTDFY